VPSWIGTRLRLLVPFCSPLD